MTTVGKGPYVPENIITEIAQATDLCRGAAQEDEAERARLDSMLSALYAALLGVGSHRASEIADVILEARDDLRAYGCNPAHELLRQAWFLARRGPRDD